MESEFLHSMEVLELAIVTAGNWRISSLVANENGPWYIFKRFRDKCLEWCERYTWCSRLHLYELVECEWCNSIWLCSMSLIFWYFFGDIVVLMLLPFALSAGVVVIKYIVQTLENLSRHLESK